MLTFLILAAAYCAWYATRAAIGSLRALPRDNQDLIFF